MIQQFVPVTLGAVIAAAGIVAPAIVRRASAQTVAQAPATPASPVILFTVSPRAVEYQLSRLTADELVRVERTPSDPKYRPVHMAILTRRGIASAARDGALAALVTLDRATPVRVLLEALGKVVAEDDATADGLVSGLLGQPATSLVQDRAALAAAIEAPVAPMVLRGAYPAAMLADAAVMPVWQKASSQAATLVELLKGIVRLPTSGLGDRLRGDLVGPVSALLDSTREVLLRAAAIDALGWLRPDATTFARVAGEITGTTDPLISTAAIRALARLPVPVWPTGPALESLARAIVAVVAVTPPARRTQPAAIDAIHFGERLTASIPEPARVAVRRELRALGVRVVRIGTIADEMLFDVRWFAVEAGKPVQVVFTNGEAMPHNVVIGRPGSLAEIALLGAAVPLPTDPAAKAYVPSTPLVLWSTRLLKEGETERLNFSAPTVPGDYVFLCTFPGHSTRMYGVMTVVPNLEAFEARPAVPIDPLTGAPFTTERH